MRKKKKKQQTSLALSTFVDVGYDITALVMQTGEETEPETKREREREGRDEESVFSSILHFYWGRSKHAQNKTKQNKTKHKHHIVPIMFEKQRRKEGKNTHKKKSNLVTVINTTSQYHVIKC